MAAGDITTRSIETETHGMAYAQMKALGMATDGTFAFGMGTDNSPAAAKAVYSVTRPGFDASANATTLTDTLYGSIVMRLAYPAEASNDVTVSGSDALIHAAISDAIYSSDTVTAAIAQGLYHATFDSSAVTAGASVTNNSTNAYPKCIGQFVTVPYQRYTGAINIEYFGGHRSARSRKPLACTVWTFTDAHSHSVSYTVSTMTLSATNASGIRLPVYAVPNLTAATLVSAGLTDGDVITLNVKAYPHYGDSSSTLDSDSTADGVAQPDERLGPFKFLLDAAGNALAPLYCVVNAAAADDAHGVASTVLATATASPFKTIAGAKAVADDTRATGENVVIYLVDGTYAWANTSMRWTGTPRVWTTIASHPTLGTRAGAIISGGDSVSDSTSLGYFRFSNLTASGNTLGQFYGSPTAGLLWFDGCALNLTGTAPVYYNKVAYATDNIVTAINGGFRAFSDAHSPWKLVRGNDMTGVAATLAVDQYCVVANTGDFLCIFLQTGNTPTQQISDGSIVAYNKLANQTTDNLPFIETGTSTVIAKGLLIACNAVRNSAVGHSGALVSIAADSSEANADNIYLWHNAFKSSVDATSGRANLGYNSKGNVGYTRVNWSIVGNNLHQYDHKDDPFADDGGANANRTGGWTILYMLGGFANCIEDDSLGFGARFYGLYTKLPPQTQAYTSLATGDLTPTSSSPSRSLVPAGRAVLPYDLAGSAFDNNGGGSAGAYQYTPDLTTPPTNLAVASTTGTTATLTWDAVDLSPVADKLIQVQRDITEDFDTPTVFTTADSTVTGFTDTGLSPTTEYFYRIRVETNASSETPTFGDWSNTASGTTDAAATSANSVSRTSGLAMALGFD
jgi:hypothetical protein